MASVILGPHPEQGGNGVAKYRDRYSVSYLGTVELTPHAYLVAQLRGQTGAYEVVRANAMVSFSSCQDK